MYFLRAMNQQVERLRVRLPARGEAPPIMDSADLTDLSPLAVKLLLLLRERKTLSVKEAAEDLKANRNTLKGKFGELVEAGVAEMRGKGRGAHYIDKSKFQD